MPQVTLEEARAAKEPVYSAFQALANVVGVGITRVAGEYAVKVNLSEPPVQGVRLPTHVDGVLVQVEVTGSARAWAQV
jgi:hypothetical protein